MKLKEGFVTHTAGQEHILVSARSGDFNGLVRLNETAAFVVEQLKQDTTLEQIADAMLADYEVDRQTALEGIRQVVEQLKGIGALEL